MPRCRVRPVGAGERRLRKYRLAAHLALSAATLCLAFGIAGGGAARAEIVQTIQYRDHAVAGSTPQSVIRYMNAHPIIDPDDGPAWANLTHDHDLTMKTAMVGGQCKVTSLTFRWRFVLTLPNAVDYGGMSGSTRAMWTSFHASLKQHEEGHRAIFLGCGKAFVPAAEKMSAAGGCSGLERKVRQFVDKKYEACMAKQRAYESRDRPRVMGAPFIRGAIGG